MQIRVLHGQVSLLGALLSEGQWHSVTSDPRKNMMVDIKNCSKAEGAKVLSKRFDGVEFELEEVPKKASLIALTELRAYTDAEEQFLLPADVLGVRNLQSSIDERKSIFSMNDSWTESLDFLVKSLGT